MTTLDELKARVDDLQQKTVDRNTSYSLINKISALADKKAEDDAKEKLEKQFDPKSLLQLMRAEQLAMRGDITGLKGEVNGLKGEITAIAVALGVASMDIKIIKADWALFDFSKHLERFTYFGRFKNPTVQRELAQKKLRKSVKYQQKFQKTGDRRDRMSALMQFEDAQGHLLQALHLEAQVRKTENALAGLEKRLERVGKRFANIA